MIWIALAIVVLAWVVRTELRRATRVHMMLATVFERIANRTAERNGEPPVITGDDTKRWNDVLP